MFGVIFGLWFEQFELNLCLVASTLVLEEKPLEKSENKEKKNTENNLFSNVFFLFFKQSKKQGKQHFFCFLKIVILRT